MENPIYVALSRQEALSRQLDVVANNIANMNTTGYKQQRMLFQEYLEKPARGERVSFVQDYGLMRDTRAGALQVTNNTLDLALKGDGYFTVETLSGPRYTRAGNFQLNDRREIVDQNGLPVLDTNDNRITVPDGTTDLKIQGDGTVMADRAQLGKLKIVSFDDQQQMQTLGGGLMTTTQTPRPSANPQVTQGAVEASNVQAIVESTAMIDVLRQYQMTQKLVDEEHDRIRNAISHLAKAQ
ncbi:flagellar basal-body rod protein FlgF [Nitrospirillum amazonense]|uniref:Flagellar basal-body rod protein FlgF n=1 Tax=Nitrospirillum amazonense TaxID=28077 RepID=A0A560K8S6_9PROT|nr:flagellar basal-body rod protein FlgF [Nitrospirillum amazonense]MDG3441765.1 flagellar basal-body rod protein FlgF [Nitrospirillum amazonense]TWB79743.1 flagellar basal-body rod protein FlgF [Nitrospirillum amazonense]